jgi:hypothetical protein
MATLLLEGPFETDYGLAIVNRRFAEALFRMGASLRLHQRHNATTYFPPDVFPRDEADLARLPVYGCKTASTITRYRAAAFRIRRLYKDPGAGERIGHAADDGYAATTAWKALAGISHV